MGVYKNALLERRDRRSAAAGIAVEADYAGAEPALLAQAVALVAGMGGTIQFGYTSDRGAYAVRLYLDGAGETQYAPATDDFNEWLRQLIEDAQATFDVVVEGRASGDIAKRARKASKGR